MRILNACFVIIACSITNNVYSQSSPFAKEADSCILTYKVSEIPRGVKKEIKRHYHERFSLARPGEKYQATDVIVGKMLKERRLIFSSFCPNEFILVYEHGGYGYHRHVILLKEANGQFTLSKNILGGMQIITLKFIKNILDEGESRVLDHF